MNIIDIYFTFRTSKSNMAVTGIAIYYIHTDSVNTWLVVTIIDICFTFRTGKSNMAVTFIIVYSICAIIIVTAILDLLVLNVKQISMIVTASHVFTETVRIE
jgi:hypothetical protein